jgi:serine/threonine protein phosphatase PrpC
MSVNDDTLPMSTDDSAGQEPQHNADGDTIQEVGWGIDKGRVRETNEDSLAAITVNQASEEGSQSIGVYAVADGMGGHDAGEVASQIAVRTAIRKLMSDVTQTDSELPDDYREWLENAVTLANTMVRKRASEDQLNMGTTLVMAVMVGREVHIVNVGDSRAYLITSDGIHRITKDHSMVQALVDSGAIKAEDMDRHPYRNILTKALGSHEEVQPDVFDATLDDDSALLLCSDGLYEMLGEDEIFRIVRASATPTEACQALIDAGNAAGGKDNIAAVLVRLGAPTGTDNDTTNVIVPEN